MANVLRPDFGPPRETRAGFKARRAFVGRKAERLLIPGDAVLYELYRREDPADRWDGEEPPPLVA